MLIARLEVAININEGQLAQAFSEAFEQSATMQKWLMEGLSASRKTPNFSLPSKRQHEGQNMLSVM